MGETIRRAARRFFDIVDASASGVFVPNREKDELTYALETPEHPGRTRGKGLISWRHGFPEDAPTYISHQRRKDEEAERIRRLEEAVLQSQEREQSLEARMQEEIKRQVELAMSSQRQSTSEHGVNISPTQLRSSYASTELPNQDDVLQCFPMDDITEKMTSCELHISMGNSTVVAATDVVSPVDPNKAPRSHRIPISPGYHSVSVDRVVRHYREVALDIPGGDGEKTLGQVEHSFIVWRKRYIIIPGVPARVPSPPHQRC